MLITTEAIEATYLRRPKWRRIKGIDTDDYSVSDDGRVRSGRRGYSRLLVLQQSRKGYLCVTLRVRGRSRRFFAHRLVAAAFIPNPERKPHVNHLNGVKYDNRAENLEWCTASENQRHAHRNGLTAGWKNQYGTAVSATANRGANPQ